MLGDIRVGGSGTTDLIDAVSQIRDPISVELREANPLECAVANGLMLTGAMATEELISGRSLEQFYGGGFEVCTVVRGELRTTS